MPAVTPGSPKVDDVGVLVPVHDLGDDHLAGGHGHALVRVAVHNVHLNVHLN